MPLKSVDRPMFANYHIHKCGRQEQTSVWCMDRLIACFGHEVSTRPAFIRHILVLSLKSISDAFTISGPVYVADRDDGSLDRIDAWWMRPNIHAAYIDWRHSSDNMQHSHHACMAWQNSDMRRNKHCASNCLHNQWTVICCGQGWWIARSNRCLMDETKYTCRIHRLRT
jgi:hypothetical protein